MSRKKFRSQVTVNQKLNLSVQSLVQSEMSNCKIFLGTENLKTYSDWVRVFKFGFDLLFLTLHSKFIQISKFKVFLLRKTEFFLFRNGILNPEGLLEIILKDIKFDPFLQ